MPEREPTERKIGVVLVIPTSPQDDPSADPWQRVDACGYIRLLLPLTHPALRRRLEVRFVLPEDIRHYRFDVMVINRLSIGSSDNLYWALEHCRKIGAQVVYDIDDLLTDLPADHAERDYYAGLAPLLGECIAGADWVTVPAEGLRKAFAGLARQIQVVPNALDERLLPPRHPATREKRARVRVLFMGNSTHDGDLRMIESDLKRVADKFGGRVEMDFIGCMPGGFKHKGFRKLAAPGSAGGSYPAFVHWLAGQARWDIGIAPLELNPFNRCKSYLKYLDYAGLGLAGIYSDIDEFRRVVRNNETGLLVPYEKGGWSEALTRAILDAPLRASLQEQASRDVFAHHTLAAQAAERSAWWERLVPEPQGVARTLAPARHSRLAHMLLSEPRRAGDFASSEGRTPRQAVAERFLSGAGIEVDVTDAPPPLLPSVSVKVVDCTSEDMRRARAPVPAEIRLLDTEGGERGEAWTALPDHSLDFIVANRFLVHCEDPLRTLDGFLRVLKEDGIIYLAVPDKRGNEDRDRVSTTLEHIVADHVQGAAVSRNFHHEEWVRLVEPSAGIQYDSPEKVRARVNQLVQANPRIRYHNWAPADFEPVLQYCAQNLPVKIELFVSLADEMVAVLRKSRAQPGAHEIAHAYPLRN